MGIWGCGYGGALGGCGIGVWVGVDMGIRGVVVAGVWVILILSSRCQLSPPICLPVVST